METDDTQGPNDTVKLCEYTASGLLRFLDALCTCRGMRKKELVEKMDAIDYHYDEETNQFI